MGQEISSENMSHLQNRTNVFNLVSLAELADKLHCGRRRKGGGEQHHLQLINIGSERCISECKYKHMQKYFTKLRYHLRKKKMQRLKQTTINLYTYPLHKYYLVSYPDSLSLCTNFHGETVFLEPLFRRGALYRLSSNAVFYS